MVQNPNLWRVPHDLSDQRLLAFHYGAVAIFAGRSTLSFCDQRLLAFHYGAGRLLKLLVRKVCQLILQVSPTIEP
jgi:hypothetical protein